MRCLAAFTDDHCRYLAEQGDEDAVLELIRRGLAYDPALLKEALKASRKQFRMPSYGWGKYYA